MKNINKQLNLSINYIEHHYKIIILVIDKIEDEYLCKIFTEYLDETKNEPFS